MTDPQPHAALTILVIEDDADTREYMEDLLTMEGYTVLTAASGRAALEQAAAQLVNGVVLDRRLPDTDGVTLCRRLRDFVDSTVPIIVVTADHDPSLETAARAAGATSFVRKPFQPSDLLQQLPHHP